MAKQVLIYGEIFTFSSEMFLSEMEALKDDDIVLRMDTVGGDPEAGFGMISKFQEHQGAKTIKVDGRAFSMGAFFLAYVDFAEALDVSSFVLHRAAFPEFMEANEQFFNENRRSRLENVNKSLRKALEAKVDVAKFEKITKVTMDQLFSMEGRVEVTLNAKQAKSIGLIDKINAITPEIKASIDTYKGESIKMAAKFVGDSHVEDVVPKANLNENKITDMDLNKLKTEHPSIYALALEEGKKLGVSQEKERIGAWMVFADVDIKGVTEAIKADKSMTAMDMAELTRKGISAKLIGNIEEEAPGTLDTAETKDKGTKDNAETIKAKAELSEFEKEVAGNLNLKTE